MQQQKKSVLTQKRGRWLLRQGGSKTDAWLKRKQFRPTNIDPVFPSLFFSPFFRVQVKVLSDMMMTKTNSWILFSNFFLLFYVCVCVCVVVLILDLFSASSLYMCVCERRWLQLCKMKDVCTQGRDNRWSNLAIWLEKPLLQSFVRWFVSPMRKYRTPFVERRPLSLWSRYDPHLPSNQLKMFCFCFCFVFRIPIEQYLLFGQLGK